MNCKPTSGKHFDFDEIIDRGGTNSIKYSVRPANNPDLPEAYIPMWIADMDFACPQPALDAMKARLDRRILGYSALLEPSYFDAVVSWLDRRHGLKVQKDCILYSSGVVSAMAAAVQTLTKPGEKVLINTPAYHPFDDSTKKFGRTPVYSKLKNTDGYYEFDFEDFEKKAKDPAVTLFFLCNPHNPTGRVWTREELRRIGEICFANGVFVFSDEIHCDLTRLDQKHLPFAAVFPGEKRIITATAPSKTFNLAGNQLSNIIVHDRALADVWRAQKLCGMPNPLAIDACRAAYDECEDWLDALRAYLDQNFAFMDAYLKEHLPAARFRVPQGTYLAWVDLGGLGMTRQELCRAVSRAGVYIEYDDEFVADAEGHVRINIACPRSALETALARICGALGGK